MPSLLERFTATKSTPAYPSSRFDNWGAPALINKAANPSYRSEEKLSKLLKADWYSFSAEYIKGELVTEIPMTLNPDVGIMGMSASYQEGVDQQGSGFVNKLKQEGKPVSRAEIENQNLSQLNQWSLTAPVHSLFIWHSPPGKKSEGYGGKDSHSFTFVYQKTAKDEVVLHQFRSWMNLQQHQQLQQFIGRPLPQNRELPLDLATINNAAIINPPEQHSPKQSKNWANTVVSKIETFVYSTNNSWKVSPEELPQVPEFEYQRFSDFLISLYIRQVVPLLLNNVPEKNEGGSEWENFYASVQYRQLVEQLDLAFAFFAYQPLLKFVGLMNQNQPANQGVLQSVLNILNSKKSEITNQMVTLPLDELESRLLFLYQIKLRELAGEELSEQDQERFNTLGSSLLATNPINRAFSLGQCGVGSVFSNQITNPNNMASMLSSPTSFNLSSLQLAELETSQLTMQEKQNRLAELKTYQPLYIKNKDTGQTETWYVKVLNQDEFSAYVHGCFIKNGQIFGPCRDEQGEAIPLTPGPVPLVEVDQQIDIFSLIPEEQYQHYLQALEYAQDEQHFAEELKTKSLEEILLDQAENTTEEREIKQLLKTARNLLTNKQVVAISELLAGEIYHPLLKGVVNKLSKYAPANFILQQLLKEKKEQPNHQPTTSSSTMATAQAPLATV